MDVSKEYIKMCEEAVEMQEIPHTAVSYLAGLIDGEGTVSIRRKTGNHFNIELYITSTNKPMLDWVVRVFKGTIYTYQRKNDTVRLPSHKWHVHGKQAENILRKVLPYLIIKGKHARLAIEFRERMNRDTSWHREFANKVKFIQKTTTYTEPKHQVTQDQLQGIMDYDNIYILASDFGEFVWEEPMPSHYIPRKPECKSMEQLWLCFVMLEKYNKKWSDNKWIK